MSGNYPNAYSSNQVSGSFEDINKLLFIERLSLNSDAMRGVKDGTNSRGSSTANNSESSSIYPQSSTPISIPKASNGSQHVPLSPLSSAINGFNEFVRESESNSSRHSASKLFPLISESPSNSNFLQNHSLQFLMGQSPVGALTINPGAWSVGFSDSNHLTNSDSNDSRNISPEPQKKEKLIDPSTSNGTNPNASPYQYQGSLGLRQQNNGTVFSPSLGRSLSSDNVTQLGNQNGMGAWSNGMGMGNKFYSQQQQQQQFYDNNGHNYNSNYKGSGGGGGNSSDNNSNNNNNNNSSNNKHQHGSQGKQRLAPAPNAPRQQNRANSNNNAIDYGSPDGVNKNGSNGASNSGGKGRGFPRVNSNNNLQHSNSQGDASNSGGNSSNSSNKGINNSSNRQQGQQTGNRQQTNSGSNTNVSNDNNNNNTNSNNSSTSNNSNSIKSGDRHGADGASASMKGSSPALFTPLDPDELAALEKRVIKSCKEILRDASARNLKAVELANTLRARVGTAVLAQVREQCQGLLTLLEKQTGVFRVDRIPKNDMVTLISDFDGGDDVFSNLDDKNTNSGRSLSSDGYLAAHMSAIYSPSLLNKSLNGSNNGSEMNITSSPWFRGSNSVLNQPTLTMSLALNPGMPLTSCPNDDRKKSSFFKLCSEPGASLVLENPTFVPFTSLISELEQYGQVTMLKKCQIDGKLFVYISYDSLENASVAKHCLSRLMKPECVSFAILNDETAPRRRSSSGSGSHLSTLKEEESSGLDLLVGTTTGESTRHSSRRYSDTAQSEYTDFSDISEFISESEINFDSLDFIKSSSARSLSHDGYMSTIFSQINPSSKSPAAASSSNYMSPIKGQVGIRTSSSANSLYSLVSNTSSAHSTHSTSGTAGSIGASSMSLNLNIPFNIPPVCGTPACNVMQRLCDDTYVPTQVWPVDVTNDAFYFQAVISQLQNFGGQTSISKLRGFLRIRVNAVDNIKSVPLKALLSAYPQLFILRNNQVSLTPYAITSVGGGINIGSSNGQNGGMMMNGGHSSNDPNSAAYGNAHVSINAHSNFGSNNSTGLYGGNFKNSSGGGSGGFR